MMGTGDNLVYDATSTGTCNLATSRCEYTGDSSASAGDTCDRPEDCELGGTCLRDIQGYPDGYCIKDRCDLAGNACANDGACVTGVFGPPTCAVACKIGEGAVEGEPATYLDNGQGCREGYTCIWDGIGGVDDETNGGCSPGVFNDVTTDNIGDACTEDEDCYSPFGLAECLDGPPGQDGQCIIQDCAAPGLPSDVCGDDARCTQIGTNDYACMVRCLTAADCRAGYACADFDGSAATATDRVCWADCVGAGECRAGERCVAPIGRTTRFCVP
jgi:hypothetical protein